MLKYKLLSIANLIAIVFTIIINSLANILPFNGRFTGELSDQIPNLFVPAGLTFSIWGVIYITLIAFGLYQIINVLKDDKNEILNLKKISFYLILGSFANIIWVILWHYEQVFLCLLFMIILLISLIMIYLRLNIGKSDLNIKEKMFIHVPFSIYLGWITVATIANITAVLVESSVGDLFLGEEIWTILLLIITAILTLIVLNKRRDIAYSLVIIWALLGISIKRISYDPIYGFQNNIAYISIIMIGVIFIGMIAFSIYPYFKSSSTKKS
jgi:hypothetical protein